MKRAVLLALLLGGCDVTASQERATDANICAGYGFREGTAEFAQCRMARDQQRQAAGMAMVNQINRNNQESAAAMERSLARPTINCTANTFGNQTQTTCR